MKTTFLRFLKFLIFAVLSCFGVSSIDQVMTKYGVPTGEFQVSGRVKNLKSKPIRNVEVEVQDIQKRSLGEFAGFGQLASPVYQPLQQGLLHVNAAVATNLHHIFACKRMWGSKHAHQHFVQHLFATRYFAIVYGICRC